VLPGREEPLFSLYTGEGGGGLQKAIWFGSGALKKKWPPCGGQLGKKITGRLSGWAGS